MHNWNIRVLFGKAEGLFTISTTALIAQTLEWYVQKYFQQSFKRAGMSDSLFAYELNWYGQADCTLLCEMKGVKFFIVLICPLLLKAKHSSLQTWRIVQVKLNFNILARQVDKGATVDRVGKLGLSQCKSFWPAT